MQTETFTSFPKHYMAASSKRQRKLYRLYGCLYLLGAFLYALSDATRPLGAAMIMPAGGFWVQGSYGLCALTLCAFALTLIFWAGAGNVVLPLLLWCATLFYPYEQATGDATILFILPPAVILCFEVYKFIARIQGKRIRQRINAAYEPDYIVSTPSDELSLEQVQDMRLLLDRALQEVESFNGFERTDQFQTGAVRYQVNFISYALSVVQQHYCPAATAYLQDAQHKLLRKQELHKVWKYWALENAWGNLKLGADPIKQDNIMYSGFVALQMLLQPNRDENMNTLRCTHPDGQRFHYTIHEMIERLVAQYQHAFYGLLPCEPNWIYPLCNMMTACAIQAYDARYGTQHWASVQAHFEGALESDYIAANGAIIPFRSSYTGFAAPNVGGLVAQAFPCLFMHSILPQTARRQWKRLRYVLRNKNLKRACWAIDVGNYHPSRASSYAASACAAQEMGDGAMAGELLTLFDASYPRTLKEGAAHYEGASLWAHANVFMARVMGKGGFAELVQAPHRHEGLHLSQIDYDHASIAKARCVDGALYLVLYPAHDTLVTQILISGCVSHKAYILNDKRIMADEDGNIDCDVMLDGRTEIIVKAAS